MTRSRSPSASAMRISSRHADSRNGSARSTSPTSRAACRKCPVANAISVPLTGWLTQRFGQVRLFLATTALFVAASLLCGLAPSMPLLIFFRIVQGAVAGPMIPLSQTLLLSTYPREKAGVALATFSLTILVAPVVGPVLGGWITDNFSWPWIFFINVPVGLVALAMTWVLYRDRETPRLRTPIDGIGLALLVVWVGALQLMLDQGKDLDWFSSPLIVAVTVRCPLLTAMTHRIGPTSRYHVP